MGNFRKKSAVVGTALGLFLIGGIVLAAWVVTGTGRGYSKAKQAQALTSEDVSATTIAQLYPGASGDATVKVNNPNPFPVTITKVSGNGAVDSDKIGCTDVGADPAKATGVTFSEQTLATDNVVPANGSKTLTLANAVSMSNASVNACQGAVFSIPVSFTASS